MRKGIPRWLVAIPVLAHLSLCLQESPCYIPAGKLRNRSNVRELEIMIETFRGGNNYDGFDRQPVETAAPIQRTRRSIVPFRYLYKFLYFVLWLAPTRLVLLIINLPINIMAYFLAVIIARTMETSVVRKAAADCLIDCVHALCLDPDLDLYVDKATATLNTDMAEDAKAMGRMVPKIAASFVQGMFSFGGRPTKYKKGGL